MGGLRRWLSLARFARLARSASALHAVSLATFALLLLAKPCAAQIGPGDGFPDAGDAPSIGEGSEPLWKASAAAGP